MLYTAVDVSIIFALVPLGITCWLLLGTAARDSIKRYFRSKKNNE